MKTIKFFSLALLLSLSWVACKDNSSSTTEGTAAEMAADSVYLAAKQSKTSDLTNLEKAVTAKIAELEASLSTADEAGKAAINDQLAIYKQYLTDLQTVSAKVAESTPATWDSLTKEIENVHFGVKMALTGNQGNMENAGKLSN